jgi:hypothetical protein
MNEEAPSRSLRENNFEKNIDLWHNRNIMNVYKYLHVRKVISEETPHFLNFRY